MPPQQTNIIFGAFPKREVARQAVVPGRSVPGPIKRIWLALREWYARRSARVSLNELSDRELTDIGLTRAEVGQLTPRGAIDRLGDGATYLWSRGPI